VYAQSRFTKALLLNQTNGQRVPVKLPVAGFDGRDNDDNKCENTKCRQQNKSDDDKRKYGCYNPINQNGDLKIERFSGVLLYIT
jgi:hypothetical protein